MKNKLLEFYPKTEQDLTDLWEKALFVTDTNVLLDLYRYPLETSNTLMQALEKLKDKGQLWIPHHVAYEFHKRRLEIIHQQRDAYGKVQSIFTKGLNDYISQNFEKACSRHLLIHKEEYEASIKRIINAGKKIATEIENLKTKHPDWESNDTILDNVTKCFEGVVGNSYNQAQYEEIIKEGVERYKKETPPGFMDDDKDERNMYGDLVIWHQIIDKATSDKKPIIFITRDQKRDWWWIDEGKMIGPRPELVREIINASAMGFHIYQTLEFINHARDKFGITLKPEAITELEKIATIDEKQKEVGLLGVDMSGNVQIVAGSASENVVPPYTSDLQSGYGSMGTVSRGGVAVGALSYDEGKIPTIGSVSASPSISSSPSPSPSPSAASDDQVIADIVKQEK